MPEPQSTDASPLRVLIVDDEKLARVRIEDLLRREPDVEIVGTAHNGALAVESIRRLRPDLVFLDVQMPAMSGLDVVRELGPDAMPATIFVTAFDRYALQAFDVAAVDYLVKPFADERFERAFRRARRRLALEAIERQRAQLIAALGRVGARSAPHPTPSATVVAPTPLPETAVVPPASYAERIAVEMRGKLVPVPVARIDYITASGSYADLRVGERSYVIRVSMQSLEERLDPARFLRVHRSVIVRLDLVDALHRGAGGDYEVQLRGGARLPVSRSRYAALERWLGMKP